MRIQVKDKPASSHVNPHLAKGRVYQHIDSKQYYIAGLIDATGHHIVLINLCTGNIRTSEGGFGMGRFIDVTENSTFVVEI